MLDHVRREDGEASGERGVPVPCTDIRARTVPYLKLQKIVGKGCFPVDTAPFVIKLITRRLSEGILFHDERPALPLDQKP